MRLIGLNKSEEEKVESHFGIFSLGPFLMAGVQDGFNSLALVTVVFLLTLLITFRREWFAWLLSAGSFMAGLGVGLYLIKSNVWAEVLDTRWYYMTNQLTYFLLAIWAVVLGGIQLWDWWILLRTGDPQKIRGKLAAFTNGPSERPRFSSSVFFGFFSLVLGFYFALMQSIYPSPPYLQNMINSMYFEGMSDQLSSYIAAYAIMVIASMISIVLLAGWAFFSPDFRSLVQRRLSVFKIFTAGVFLSIGIGLLYLLNQPFLGG